MKNRKISSQLQRVNALITKTDLACGGDIELQSHWAKYLCLVCTGVLENAIEEIFGAYATQQTGPAVARYVRITLAKVQNPNKEKFIQIAQSFKVEWGRELELFISEEGRQEALQSLIGNRNNIAHGENSNITIAQIKEYLAKSVDVLEHIEDLCV